VLTVKFRPWDDARVAPEAAGIGFEQVLMDAEIQVDGKPVRPLFRQVPPGRHTISVRDPRDGNTLDVSIEARSGRSYLLSQTPASPLKPFSPGLPALEYYGPTGGSITRMHDGRYLMAFTRGLVTPGIWLAESKDGRQWSEPWEFSHNDVFQTTRANLFVDDAGVLWMAYFSKRLAVDFSSAGGLLWLCRSEDGRNWETPQPIRIPVQAQYHDLAHFTRDHKGRCWLFYNRFAGSGARPDDITELTPLNLPVADDVHPQNPYAVFDANGTCHLVFDDYNGRSLYYTRSADMRIWSNPVLLAEKAPNAECPQLLLDDKRAAVVYETHGGTVARSGELVDSGLRLGTPVFLTGGLTRVKGGRVYVAGGEAMLFAAGSDYAPWLLIGRVEDLLRTGESAVRKGP
jgi:hypothetical protein